jgi:hypothetical protein
VEEEGREGVYHRSSSSRLLDIGRGRRYLAWRMEEGLGEEAGEEGVEEEGGEEGMGVIVTVRMKGVWCEARGGGRG